MTDSAVPPKTVYFDNGSTSVPKAPGVTQAITDYLTAGAYNVGRGGYAGSFDIGLQILECREHIATLFNADDLRTVIFTPSLTYSLNAILQGFLNNGDHVITTSMEHNSVMRPLHELQKQRTITYDTVTCDNNGMLNPDDIIPLINSNTKAIVMTHASNVCGTILPIDKVAEICASHNLRLIVDAAQTAGVLSIDASTIDALAFPGHKGLLGSTGIGGFIIKQDFAKSVHASIWGGTGSQSHGFDQPSFLPDKFESGTQNIAGILGLKTAIEYIQSRGINNIYQHEMKLYQQFVDSTANITEMRLIATSPTVPKVPVISVDFPNHDIADIATQLDRDYGIMARCGLHCAPAAHKTLGTYPAGTLRFSFGHNNTASEVDCLLHALQEILD
ncbi:MAG: aminotransferase class V-fold PLP-dependent enzyme [Coriobacteriia bacterium]|nr:aminotransferase class V-fold PLP-dependent enzyme [Coriobacteriia bacterium]